MKIFNQTKQWEEKVNFVDDNNVMLGYDLSQDCCEHADWFIADEPYKSIPDHNPNQPGDLPGWNFDPSYKNEVDFSSDEYSEDNMVIFRIVNEGEEKFIHLFNVHNGYYGHGFEFTVGDQTTGGVL